MSVLVGILFNNGRKDKGFKYSVRLVPQRLDEAIKTLEDMLVSLKEYKRKIESKETEADLLRKEF